MKKAVFSIIICLGLLVPVTNGFPVFIMNPTLANTSEDLTEVLSMENKKGQITRKNGDKFSIVSEDGNTYQAFALPGYDVGDEVYHSDPAGGMVTILGHTM